MTQFYGIPLRETQLHSLSWNFNWQIRPGHCTYFYSFLYQVLLWQINSGKNCMHVRCFGVKHSAKHNEEGERNLIKIGVCVTEVSALEYSSYSIKHERTAFQHSWNTFSFFMIVMAYREARKKKTQFGLVTNY